MMQMQLVEFSQARLFRNQATGDHIDDDFNYVQRTEKFVFTSVNQLNGHTPSRRDDIIQILQILVYLLDDKKEWIQNRPEEEGEQNRIRIYKQTCTPADLCAGQKTQLLAGLMTEAYGYQFNEEPRYDYIIATL